MSVVAATVPGENGWGSAMPVAGTMNYRPLDVVRPLQLPCEILAEVAVDLRDGAPVLRLGWLGVTKTGDRCDLPYGEVPPCGAYWFTRIGLQSPWRGAPYIEERELEAGESWLRSFRTGRCR